MHQVSQIGGPITWTIMISISSHLNLSRHNIYYFRVVAPEATGKNAGREIRLSLKTKNLPSATRYSAILKRKSENLFRWLSVGEISWNELKKILRSTLSKSIEQFSEDISLNGPKPKYTEDIWELNQIPNWERSIHNIEKLELSQIKNPDNTPVPIPENVQCIANKILKNNGIAIEVGSSLYLKFCKAALEMNIALTTEALSRNKVEKRIQLEPELDISEKQHIPASTHKVVLFSSTVEKYVKDKKKGNKWSSKTEAQNRVAFDLLIEVLGDIDMGRVGYPHSMEFKEALLGLPSNRKKKPAYRDMLLDDILNLDIPEKDKLSSSKVNAYLGNVSGLFQWAVRHGVSTINPFSGINISDNTADKEKKLPFTEVNLKAIFDDKIFTSSVYTHPHYYWLPFLGLYTGARLNELCQLYLEDLKCLSGVWVFDFNDEHEKKLKNSDSKRVIPIHASLIELGLVQYKLLLESQGETRLFPELKLNNNPTSTYGDAPSKWFGRFLIRIGIKHKQISFHSFRHTVIDHLKQIPIEEPLIQAIVGHKNESITTGVYGGDYKSSVLTPVIEKLDFGIPSYPFIYKGKDLSIFDK